ncbi:MAG: MFS transporter [Firmicutes bacterium]|nr:MFS transporter [Bacillota bacterium]
MKIISVKDFFKNRTVLFFLTGTFFMMLNMSMAYIVIPVYLVSTGASVAQVGMSTAFYSIVAIILRVFLGPVADNRGRKFSMLASTITFLISTVFIWVAPNFIWHLFARAIQAISLALFMSTGSSVISDLSEENNLATFMGIYRALLGLGFLVGPIFSLAMIKISYDAMFIANIIISIIAFIFLMQVTETCNYHEHKTESSLLLDYKGLLGIRKLRKYYYLTIMLAVGYGTVMATSANYLYSLSDTWSPSIFIFLLSGSGMLASMTAGWLIDKFSIKKIIVPAVSIAVIGMLGMATISWFGNIALVGVGIIFGLGNNSAVICAVTGVDSFTSTKLKATSFSIQESSIDGGNAIGNFIFGWVALVVGYANAFIVLGSIMAIGCFLLLADREKAIK